MAENNESSLSPPDELEQRRIFSKELNRRIIQARIAKTIDSLKKKYESPESLRTLADIYNENKITLELSNIFFYLTSFRSSSSNSSRRLVGWNNTDNKLNTLQKELVTRDNFLTGAQQQQQPLDKENYVVYALTGNEEYIKNMLLEAEMNGVKAFLVHRD